MTPGAARLLWRKSKSARSRCKCFSLPVHAALEDPRDERWGTCRPLPCVVAKAGDSTYRQLLHARLLPSGGASAPMAKADEQAQAAQTPEGPYRSPLEQYLLVTFAVLVVLGYAAVQAF